MPAVLLQGLPTGSILIGHFDILHYILTGPKDYCNYEGQLWTKQLCNGRVAHKAMVPLRISETHLIDRQVQ